MDLQEMSRKISAAEKKKAQLELLDKQNKEEAAALQADMKKAGVTGENIDQTITNLEARLINGIDKIDKIIGQESEAFV